MFDELFVRYHAISRHENSPLLEDRRRYLIHCAEQGMSRETLKEIATFLLPIVDFLALESRAGEEISLDEISGKAELWVKREPLLPGPKDIPGAKRRFIKHARRWLKFLGRLEDPAVTLPPYHKFIQQFADSEKEKNLSPRSTATKCRQIRDFLSQSCDNEDSLQHITIADVDEALARKSLESGYTPAGLQGYASSIRVFLRYAESRGWCPQGLSNMIMTPRVYQHDTLPTGPSWEVVQELLATTEEDRPAEIRNRALLLLLAVYGLRSREVALLKLEDLDWEQELIHITRPKQRKQQVYPLARSVGDAILRYLQEVRPRCSHREVFLTLRAPFRSLSNGSLYQIVSRRLRALGVELNHYGPHCLRHACASRLIQSDFSLKEIGDHLGHKNLETTRIYAKVNIKGLRQVGDFDIGGVV